MTNDPIIEFPVIASLREGRRQFITTWSLKTVLLCLSSIADHATQRAGLRINNNAASKIALEWTEAGECPSVKPIALAFSSVARFVPLPSAPNTGIGMLSLSLGAILDVLDGIQRIAALQKVTILNQNLSQSSWPVHLIEVADDHDLAILTASWEKTRLATGRLKNKPRSHLTDHSPWIAKVLAGSVFLKHTVATGKSSLSPRSPRLWTGSAVRNAFNVILNETRILPTDDSAQSFSESWDSMANAVPDLNHYLAKTTTARELRANTILASASIIPALAEITLILDATPQKERQSLLASFALTDWSRNTGAWPEIVPRVLQKEAWTKKLLEHCGLADPKPQTSSPVL